MTPSSTFPHFGTRTPKQGNNKKAGTSTSTKNINVKKTATSTKKINVNENINVKKNININNNINVTPEPVIAGLTRNLLELRAVLDSRRSRVKRGMTYPPYIT